MSLKDSNVRVAPASQMKRRRAAPGASAHDEYLGLLAEVGSHGFGDGILESYFLISSPSRST